MENLIEVHVPEELELDSAEDLYSARAMFAALPSLVKPYHALVTIYVQAYNKLEKTKRCIESILKYTGDVDYELLLIDNGSTDETLEYFKSIDYDRKIIVHIDHNIGSALPYLVVPLYLIENFMVMVQNDLIVTENWLSNMLKVMESDPKIGLVNPAASNTSNFQCVNMQFETWEEMQERAREYNRSDPAKWQERIRIVTLATLYRKECIYAMGWPIGDMGFIHDFGDDDAAFRVRRSGYKAVVAMDTWVCHDHPVTDRYGNDKVARSITFGRQNFMEKYHGIDAWEDVNNFIFHLINPFVADVASPVPTILGVDVKCGTPILDVKNIIRRFGKYQAELSAFTQEDKYSIDLYTICEGSVVCDREEFFAQSFAKNSFDYIVFGREINCYHEPPKMIMDAYEMLRPGGQIIFALKNAENIHKLMYMMGRREFFKKDYCIDYPLDPFSNTWKNMGMNIELVNLEYFTDVSDEEKRIAQAILEQYGNENRDEMMNRLLVGKYWFVIRK